ncbi:MAG: hypothetical protein DRG82_06260 [Deltaproteobacteria bacterium]|nr:MAG: hypothetical protein DRG82_06260 [Deltaproteobacteria bacterium]
MAKVLVGGDGLSSLKIMEEKGHDVIIMDNDMTLLQIFEKYFPDLVVLDVFMKEKNNAELLKEMNFRAQRRGEWPMPIILLIGDDSKETECVAQEVKADFVLTKPFSEEELFEVTSRLITESRRRKRLQQRYEESQGKE